MRFPLITLLTDFGLEDEYVGVMKGVLLSIHPRAVVVDLCHQVPPGDVEKAGWLLAWSWKYFPKGTIHVVVVDPGVGSSRKILCLDFEGHLFLAPDNGLLSHVVREEKRPRLYAVTNRRYALKAVSHTFHGRDLFAPAAGYLSRGLSPSRLGPRTDEFKRLPSLEPTPGDGKKIEGRIIALDRFGNAVTNLSAPLVDRFKKKGRVRIDVGDARLRGRQGRLRGVQRSYSAVPKGTPLTVIGSHDLLEIAVNRGSAERKLRLKIGDPVVLRVE